jgi:hypothetical protein
LWSLQVVDTIFMKFGGNQQKTAIKLYGAEKEKNPSILFV